MRDPTPMTNWLKRISDVISPSEKDEAKSVDLEDSLNENVALFNTKELKKTNTFFTHVRLQRSDPSFANRHEIAPPPYQEPKSSYTQLDAPSKPIAGSNEANMRDLDEKLSALQRLRDLPRGTQVESRIAAITDLLGEGEIFKTLKILRWPQGVICPRCKSSNVVRRDPPFDALDQRHFYICLNCKGEGNPSDFDDFTGLPVDSLSALRQCILCWYLIGFCTLSQIAKVLGLSMSEVMKLAAIGTELTELPENEAEKTLALQEHAGKAKNAKEKKRTTEIEKQEEETRSESKAIYKPGPKSKK